MTKPSKHKNSATSALNFHMKLFLSLVLLAYPLTNLYAQGLDFMPHEIRIAALSHNTPIISYDINQYGATDDYEISSVYDFGIYACGATCPVIATQAGAAYYKQFQISGYGTVTVYYDVNGNILGSGADLDGDGIGDTQDSDIDGDGIENIWDVFVRNPLEWADNDSDGIGDNADSDTDGDGIENNTDPDPNVYTVAGSVNGSFNVSAGGSASYSLPIVVPPGVGGMAPRLALNYSSQGGNGLVGMGWRLTGLGAVSRCPQTFAQDGNKQGRINFTPTDRFCLNGKRLIAVNGAYGQADTEYRTERDEFSRITSMGQINGAPQWFQAETKDGQIFEYGNTDPSRINVTLNGTTPTRLWAVNKVTDASGNYLTVSYMEDVVNGEYYPTRIDYTFNDTSGSEITGGGNGQFYVQFNYAARSDVIAGYLAGAKIQIQQRLTHG